MNKKQITVDQHFVPQCYLENFTNGDGKTFVYNKTGQLLNKKYTPKQVLFRKLLYEFDLDNPDNLIEDFFSRLENEYSLLSKKLLSLSGPDDFILDKNEQVSLLLFVLRLTLGNPTQYDKNNSLEYNKIWKRELEIRELSDLEKIRSLEALAEENRKTLPIAIQAGFNPFFIEQIFSRKKFLFYLSNGSNLFLTGDNPVLEWYTESTGLFPGTTTLADVNYGVALSPYIHLQIVNITDHPEIPNLGLLEDRLGEISKKHNSAILKQAMNFVYANFCDYLG